MQFRVLFFLVVALALAAGIGFTIWLALMILKGFFDAGRQLTNYTVNLAKKLAHYTVNGFRNFLRRRKPVQIVGLPDLTMLKRISGLLDEFTASVQAYRPRISHYDDRFRSVTFSYPFETVFPRKNSDAEGPDPKSWPVTLGSLAIQVGRPMQLIYDGLGAAAEFPEKEPSIVLNLQPPPQLPKVQLPKWSIKLIAIQDGSEIDIHSDKLTKIYAPEIKQAKTLQREAEALQKDIKRKLKEAEEEQELMDLFITNQKLLKKSIATEFQATKKRYEEQAAKRLAPIRSVYKNYLLETNEGIEQHFNLGLETLPLPLPPGFPWRVFYDRDEQLLQINQRVPFLSDIVVKRSDSNRAPAKRDVDNLLRRIIPAISLHIAANVAANDQHNHVRTLAVNCWSRSAATFLR